MMSKTEKHIVYVKTRFVFAGLCFFLSFFLIAFSCEKNESENFFSDSEIYAGNAIYCFEVDDDNGNRRGEQEAIRSGATGNIIVGGGTGGRTGKRLKTLEKINSKDVFEHDCLIIISENNERLSNDFFNPSRELFRLRFSVDVRAGPYFA